MVLAQVQYALYAAVETCIRMDEMLYLKHFRGTSRESFWKMDFLFWSLESLIMWYSEFDIDVFGVFVKKIEFGNLEHLRAHFSFLCQQIYIAFPVYWADKRAKPLEFELSLKRLFETARGGGGDCGVKASNLRFYILHNPNPKPWNFRKEPPMASAVVGVIFDALCGELVNAIKEVRAKSKEFKPLLRQLESTLDRMTPTFEDIESLNRAVHRPETEYAVFADQLNEGKSLVLKCARVRWWNKSSYAKKLIEYDRSLTRFFQIDVTAQILHSVRRVEGNLAGEGPMAEIFMDVPETEEPAPSGGVAEHPLDFLRNSPQFLALRPLLQSNPHILQRMRQGLGKKHPHISRHIEEHEAEFHQLINAPVDGSDGDLSDQPEQEMPHAINVSLAKQETPHTISVILAEQEAIERLEEMGFDGDLVIEAFLACDGNEELAVNYLLEDAGYFED
ncbi:uncharacterized protein LOC131298764 [Rhododendron vialii]|uniref:uncharacterized protein LOC131298764 n=1 Tax=Rhododendron vialii TaxID=182163 RepID=UPI00265FCEF5|nr:uncharacterized protein LOC131298764 [Rhododendron vialii]